MVLRSDLVAFPTPSDNWLQSTRDAYDAYTCSEVAFAVEPEALTQVRLLFEYHDRIQRLLNGTDVDGEPRDSLRVAQEIKIYDSMAARLASELGIGPLARTRLGLAKLDEGEKASKLDGFLGSRP